MFEQGTLRFGNGGNGKALGLSFLQWLGFEERDHLVEDRVVARGADVMSGDERKPEKIITDPSADPGAGLGMPPMLDIAFDELARGRAQDLLADDPGRGCAREP